MSQPAKRPPLLGLLVALAALVLAAWAIAGWSGIDPLRELGQRRAVAPSAFGSGRLAERLASLGALHPRPFDPAGAEPSTKGRQGPAVWSLDELTRETLPSSLLVPPERIATGRRIVSVALPEEHWQELLAEPGKRGMGTERPGYATFWDGGRITFATGAGIRLHGGMSRYFSPHKSLRLYVHRLYGAPVLPAEVLPWEGALPLRRLILHNDTREDAAKLPWHFTGPLAYDLTREIGARAPRTAPAWVYVNGELQGLYFLTERLDLDWVENQFGHQEFVLLRTKRDRGTNRYRAGNPDLYKRLHQRMVRSPRLSLAMVGEEVDVDNLLRWAVAVLFCGTTDAFQGPLLRDETDPDGRWFWINYDMDHSFMSQKFVTDRPWELSVFHLLFRGRHPDLRAILLRRLAREDPDFPRVFRALALEALDEHLTQSFLDERLAWYQGVAATYELEDRAFLDQLGEFLRRRREIFRQQLDAAFPPDGSTSISSPGRTPGGGSG